MTGRDAPPPRVVLVGPAGCGKTTVGRRLATALAVPFVDGDDLHAPADVARMRRGEPLDDAARAPWLDRVGDTLAAAAARGEGLVVACSALRQRFRDRLARAAGGDVRFVELRVDAATLGARLERRRDHFFPAALLASQLAAFEPLPAPDQVDGTLEPDAVAAAVRRLLSGHGAP